MAYSLQAGADQSRAALLRTRAHAFCTRAFESNPASLLDRFFTSESPKITEHGPDWASERLPFLARTLKGHEECLQYFDLLASSLKVHRPEDDSEHFPGADGFTVDPEAKSEGGYGVVVVVGKARFSSVTTGKSWNEQFIYKLSDWSEDGKIGHWEIWADPLSAWKAVGNETFVTV